MADLENEQPESERVHWHVRVPAGCGSTLNRRLLGLTFVERRRREAQKWGIDHVTFLLPDDIDAAALPEPTKPGHCAPSSTAPADAAPDSEGATVYEVPLFAMLDSKAPFAVALPLEPDGPFEPAVAWYRKQIVEMSNAGWVAMHINKPISFALSTRLARTFVTPNQWSYLNLVIGVLSGVFVAREEYWAVVLGAFLFQVASVFDGVDGEIAKFRLEYSRFGAWLDTSVDNGSLLLFLIGVGVHLFRFSALPPTLLLGLTVTAGVCTVLYLSLQMHFCMTKLNSISLAVWTKLFVAKLPRRDLAVRFVLRMRQALQKDFFSFFFMLIGLTGRLELLLFIGTTALIIALGCVLYLNTRYGSQAHAA